MVNKEHHRFIGDFSSTLQRYIVVSMFCNITNSPSAGLLLYSEVSCGFFLSFSFNKILKMLTNVFKNLVALVTMVNWIFYVQLSKYHKRIFTINDQHFNASTTKES